jgi:hypothetical protein
MFKTYLKPFADDTGSAYATDWIDITDDVGEYGGLTQALDNTEYEVGVFRTANLKLSLLNHHGKYSDVGGVYSLFRYKRSDSLIKVTWQPGNHPLVCGFFTAGSPDAILSEEVTLFEGMLSDIATQSKIDDADIDFQVLGYESLLAQMTVPYSSISNGNSLATAIYTCLNQSPFNTRVTVSSGNITTGASATIDDKADLENKTVLEALKTMLLASNSVLYIRDNVVYVGPRTASTDLEFTFYGPGASAGIENIDDITNFRIGLNKIRNYWTWKNTTLVQQDTSSVTLYGVQKREINLAIITNTTKRNTLLSALLAEFQDVKREMIVETAMTPSTLALYLLDKVSVDYPSVALVNENEAAALYGIGEYDVNYYADELLTVTIEDTARFKIMSRVLDFKNEVIKFALREV